MSSHLINELASVADHMAVIGKGKLLAQSGVADGSGTPRVAGVPIGQVGAKVAGTSLILHELVKGTVHHDARSRTWRAASGQDLVPLSTVVMHESPN